jgi:porphyrinogen peroxidase
MWDLRASRLARTPTWSSICLSMTTGGVNLVVGFKPLLWARVAPEEMPADVTDFVQDVHGVDGYTMPATQHDLWV